jgi:hypothetical protein
MLFEELADSETSWTGIEADDKTLSVTSSIKLPLKQSKRPILPNQADQLKNPKTTRCSSFPP